MKSRCGSGLQPCPELVGGGKCVDGYVSRFEMQVEKNIWSVYNDTAVLCAPRLSWSSKYSSQKVVHALDDREHAHAPPCVIRKTTTLVTGWMSLDDGPLYDANKSGGGGQTAQGQQFELFKSE